MRNLLTVLALVFAALQLIPAFGFPKAQVPFLVSTVVAFGIFAFMFLQASRKKDSAYRNFIPGLTIAFLAVGVAGYKLYTLRGEVGQLREQLESYRGAGPTRKYLDTVVSERDAQWDNEFEKRYARPTLYLLNRSGTREHSPTEIQNHLLLWRTGTEGMSAEFRGVAGLVGGTTPGKTNTIHDVVKGIANYVDRPLADSDLLNKRLSDPSKEASDDLPARILVLGDPAAGKSSMLERLDLIQARRARGSKEEPIPVLVNLKGISHPTKDVIMSKVRERLGNAADPVFASRKIVLMLDSLDETGFPAEAAGAIAEIASHPAWDRIIVASRLLNYSEQLHFHTNALWRHSFVTAILYGLDQTAVEKQILTRATDDVRRKIFLKLAQTSTRQAWLQFLRLPLDFDLVLGLMEESDGDVLPQAQSELIQRFVEKRFEHKGIDSPDAVNAQEVLSRVGVNLLKNGIGTRSRDFGLHDALPETTLTAGSRDAQLQHCEERLRQAVETGIVLKARDGRYKFFHLNILDYFAARGLHDLSAINPADVHWRQIILFRAGMSDGAAVVDLVKKSVATNRDDRLTDYLQHLFEEVRETQATTTRQSARASVLSAP